MTFLLGVVVGVVASVVVPAVYSFGVKAVAYVRSKIGA